MKLGKLPYINALPVYHGFDSEAALPGMQIVEAIPSRLNILLNAGEIQMSPISSIEYCCRQDEYLLIDDLSISSKEKVGSVLLFSRYPLCDMKGKKIWVTSASATSKILAHIVFSVHYGFTVEIVQGCELDLASSENISAILVIGDRALKESYRWSRDPVLKLPGRDNYACLRYDMGELWRSLSGEEMVFAVWAVRKEYAASYGDRAGRVAANLKKSRDYGLMNMDGVIKDAAQLAEIPEPLIRDYYQNLNYHLDSPTIRGLLAFYRMAHGLDLSPSCRTLHFMGQS
jgi:chorismate dehydratase